MHQSCTHCWRAGANVFVDVVFHDCIYSTSDWTGFLLQLISIGAWVVAQVPQFIDNYKNESAEALSPWFLAEWFLGDASNLVGCMLTGTQLPLTTTTACYFVGCDIAMMVQYTYYATKARRRQRRSQQRAMRDARRNRQAYDDANAYAILQTQRHLSGYQATSSRRLQSHCVHSVPNLTLLNDTAWAVHTLPSPTSSPEQSRHRGNEHNGQRQSSRQQADEHAALHRRAEVLDLAEHAGSRITMSRACAAAAGGVAALTLCLLVATAGVKWPSSTPDKAAIGSFHGALLLRPAAQQAASRQSDLSKGPQPDTARPKALRQPGFAYAHPAQAGDVFSGHRVPAISHSAGLPSQQRAFFALAQNAPGQVPLCPTEDEPHWTQTMGLIVGYVAAVAYLKSRVSQLMQNLRRGDAEGLSMSMFLCAICGNLLGAVGIIIRLESVRSFLWQLPWLIGMLGTVFMDVLIAMQAHAAGRRRKCAGQEAVASDSAQEPLLA